MDKFHESSTLFLFLEHLFTGCAIPRDKIFSQIHNNMCDHLTTCDDILIPSTHDVGTVKIIYFLYEINNVNLMSINLCCESSQGKL